MGECTTGSGLRYRLGHSLPCNELTDVRAALPLRRLASVSWLLSCPGCVQNLGLLAVFLRVAASAAYKAHAQKRREKQADSQSGEQKQHGWRAARTWALRLRRTRLAASGSGLGGRRILCRRRDAVSHE
jgi:hypothetical protein